MLWTNISEISKKLQCRLTYISGISKKLQCRLTYISEISKKLQCRLTYISEISKKLQCRLEQVTFTQSHQLEHVTVWKSPAPAGYFVVIVMGWIWLLSFKVTCSISFLSVDSKLHCYYNYYSSTTHITATVWRKAHLFVFFALQFSKSTQWRTVKIVWLLYWGCVAGKKCGVVVVGLRCS